MMNIFLTGDIQIGKTTALNKALRDFYGDISDGDGCNSGGGGGGGGDGGGIGDGGSGGGISGLVTYGGPVKPDGTRDVYLKAWGAPDTYDETHCICERLSPPGRRIYPEVFETTGTAILRETLSANPGIIILDELGVFEENCESFKTAVFACLSSDVPVLGVLKKAASGFLDSIRNKPGVEVIEVTRENRDSVPLLITAMLQTARFAR